MVAVVIDTSPSVWDKQGVFAHELAMLRKEIPKLRVIHFNKDAVVVDHDNRYFGKRFIEGHTGLGSNMLPGIRLAAFVLSDGFVGPPRDVLQAVRRMTGNVHAFHAESSEPLIRNDLSGLEFMKSIALAGQGKFYPVAREGDFCPQLIRRAFRDTLNLKHEREPAMKRPPQITRVRGGEINVNAPGDQVHDIVERVHLIHRQEINHHYAEAEHIHHGGPVPIEVYVDPTQVRVHTSAPTVHYHGAPQSIPRGEVRPAPQQAAQPGRAALSPPSGRAPAPEPQQPMQLTDQRATPLGFWSTLFSPQKVRR